MVDFFCGTQYEMSCSKTKYVSYVCNCTIYDFLEVCS